MARRSKDEVIDLSKAQELTAGLIEGLACPEGKAQAFLRDSKAPGLRVRVTAAGAKSFVFESKVKGKTYRTTIGTAGPFGLSIDDARKKVPNLRKQMDEGQDPREVARKAAEDAQKAAEEARRIQAEEARAAEVAVEAEAAQALTVGEAWGRYVTERTPYWGDANIADHASMADPGGRERKRLTGVLTKPGPLAALMSMRLVDLDAHTVEQWAKREAADRPARVRLALRLLKAFLRWAAAESDLSDRVNPTAISAKKAREAAGKPEKKDDVLQRGQLHAWFSAVRGIPNQVTAAYLQMMLLTGARPGEPMLLRWTDINPQWQSIVMRDKEEGERMVPLTPYVWNLLQSLPRRNQWVFASVRTVSESPKSIKRRERYHAARGTIAPDGPLVTVSKSGRIEEPGIAHRQACARAGLQGLTLHGLRRSFTSLTEWLEIPAGVVAQLQGHKPSATAEKHYKVRPLELLALHHERIEAWMLEQAGIEFDAKAAKAKGLRLVVA